MAINQKGQAFSAFKLLIAAVIAVAILGILMPILSQVTGIITKAPGEEISMVLANQVGNPGNYTVTNEFTFKPNEGVSTMALAAGTPGLSADQICLSLGEGKGGWDDSSNFVLTAGDEMQNVQWTGAANQTARAGILCAGDGETAEDALGTYGKDAADIDCPDACEDSRCCIVILQRPR